MQSIFPIRRITPVVPRLEETWRPGALAVDGAATIGTGLSSDRIGIP